ncbi:MAG: hypothetical protein HPY57_14525 [Ignavibacteria bacterium]|nr:hypothetical protein [Ignavibacteria bacterium]
MIKSKHYSSLIRKIRNFTFDNGVKIVIKSESYKSSLSGSYTSIVGNSSPIYSADLVLKYDNGTFLITKNRFGDNNIFINIKELNFLYREEKLKRILK